MRPFQINRQFFSSSFFFNPDGYVYVILATPGTHPMAKTLHRILIVTAADFNGSDFDGSPVDTMFEMAEGESIKDVAPWFLEALKKEEILIEARGSTDYAWFGVKTDCNNIYWAGPGDAIAYDMGRLTMIPASVIKYMKREFQALETSPGIGRSIKLEANAMQFHGEYRPLPLED